MAKMKVDYVNGESRTFEVEDTGVIEDALLSGNEGFSIELTDGTMQTVHFRNVLGINYEPEEVEIFGDED